MRLFLIRHGETVDNVAAVYAGVRDSPLTSHGVLQSQRLGAHFAKRQPPIGVLMRVFSSDLQRALSTAQAIVDVQSERELSVEALVDLRERDFGSSEGKSFTTKSKNGSASTGHPDAETREQMRVRMVRFVTAHLAPVLEASDGHTGPEQAVVVVAHGIILNVLLRVLWVTYVPEEQHAESAPLVGWSNTGYTEISVGLRSGQGLNVQPGRILRSKLRFRTVASNQTIHLDGLKRTRGGIGSAQFDKKQKTMDFFFTRVAKKAKRDDSDVSSDL